MTTVRCPAKLNLALVVGSRLAGGKHEVVTVLQRIDLADRLTLEPGNALRVTGFDADTLVADALRRLAAELRVEPGWHVRLEKRIPVAAGLGGGSSDAAGALELVNASLGRPLAPDALTRLAAELGADIPFFLARGPQLGTGDGSRLQPLDLPLDYRVLLVLPHGSVKASTRAVYERFDERSGEEGFAQRRDSVLAVLESLRQSRDLARLPPNDLGSSSLAAELRGLGAFRADVTGAGPAVYGLFEEERAARAASVELAAAGKAWICRPTW
jgi:4-diphosphocytidyl-2-C-methyl-D-erythritol kinase